MNRARWRARIPLIVILVLTLAGIGAIFYGVGHQSTLEPLDRTSQDRINAACTKAVTSLRELVRITSQSTIAERAGRTDVENTIFEGIVHTAETLHPPDRDGAIALRGWTADWKALLHSRARFAAELRGTAVAKPKLLLPLGPDGAPITKRMTEYARTHDLLQCETDNLQAEIVDGDRLYPTNLENG
jgi:hypothetical protein